MLRGIRQLGIDPVGGATPEQQRAIASSLNSNAVAILTGTGSGKTLSYLLPLISRLKTDEARFADHDGSFEHPGGAAHEHTANHHAFRAEPLRPRAVVLAPSRELCAQITGVAKILAHNCKLRVLGMDGSRPMRQQRKALENGVDLVIATPGRLQRHKENGDLYLSQVVCLVLDEADALVGSDFGDDALRTLQSLRMRDASVKRSARRGARADRCVFTVASATSSKRLEAVMKAHMPNVVRVVEQDVGPCASDVSAENATLGRVPLGLKEEFARAPRRGKYDVLIDTIQQNRERPSTTPASTRSVEPTLVFCNTVKSCRAAEHFLANSGFSTCGYHSDMPPGLRTSSFARFRDMEVDVMVCTDVAARGLDLRHVRHVINLDVPQSLDWYLHRAGRTARAGDKGRVTTIFTKDDSILTHEIRDARRAHAKNNATTSKSSSKRVMAKGGNHWKKKKAKKVEKIYRKGTAKTRHLKKAAADKTKRSSNTLVYSNRR